MIDDWFKWKKATNIDNLTVEDFPDLHNLGVISFFLLFIHKIKSYKFIGKDCPPCLKVPTRMLSFPNVPSYSP